MSHHFLLRSRRRPAWPLLLLIGLTCLAAGEPRKPNILFIAVDDLRPELGCYGAGFVKSPHIDKLASQGLLFNRAYCNEAICGPSRASLMTGLRPDTVGVVENRADFRKLNPDVVTLPQHLIAHGYQTVYSGKIFHPNQSDQEHSWSTKPDHIPGKKRGSTYVTKENHLLVKQLREEAIAKYGIENTGGLTSGNAIEAADVEDDTYSDGYNTSVAINTLERLVKSDKPWFLGMGYKLPHLPFAAPKKYFDLYDPAKLKLAEPKTAPKDGASVGLHASFELRTRAEIPKSGDLDENLSRNLLQAYYACTSYVDAQIGRMLAALDEHGVRDNTIIILWGDHGWHLGEMGIWGKATNYEISTRVPLIISTPDMQARGATTEALVELVDIYPTLCELAGITPPTAVEGRSFVPLLDQPAKTWKDVAISQFPCPALREWAANPLSKGMRETFFGPLIEQVEAKIALQFGKDWDRDLFENHLMGYSVRSATHRMVTWRDHRNQLGTPIFVELYDHVNDPSESVNIAKGNETIVADLSKKLAATMGWK